MDIMEMLFFFWEHKIGRELGSYFCEYSFEDIEDGKKTVMYCYVLV
jgi:hypothetical protein